MGILPVINCADFAAVKKTIEKTKTFLPEGSFVHCDIADAAVTFHSTWNNPEEWASLRVPYQLEVHLMVEHPELQLDAWMRAGARRFIIQFETVDDKSLDKIITMCRARSVGLALSSNPETTVDRLAPYLKFFSMFQVLAVHPGLAGQPFLPFSIEKIAWLHREYPNAIIEVDGAMNAQTAQLVKDAGANFIVSSSYIFGTPGDGGKGDPKISYEILTQI